MPDETTILNFRHLLEAHQLAESLFQEVVSLLTEQGLILREGTIVDAMLIAACRWLPKPAEIRRHVIRGGELRRLTDGGGVSGDDAAAIGAG